MIMSGERRGNEFQILNIGARFAKCSIICVGNSVLSHPFNAHLRREDIQATEKDKVQMHFLLFVVF